MRLLDSLAMRTAMRAAVEDRPRWIEVGDRPDPMSIALPYFRRPVGTSAGQRACAPGPSLGVALLGFFVVTLDALWSTSRCPRSGTTSAAA